MKNTLTLNVDFTKRNFVTLFFLPLKAKGISLELIPLDFREAAEWHQREISKLQMLLLKDNIQSRKEQAAREGMRNSVDRGRMTLKSSTTIGPLLPLLPTSFTVTDL